MVLETRNNAASLRHPLYSIKNPLACSELWYSGLQEQPITKMRPAKHHHLVDAAQTELVRKRTELVVLDVSFRAQCTGRSERETTFHTWNR